MEPSRSRGDDIFKRGLDRRFEEALLGPMNLLLRLVREADLDLQIRENYISVYEGRGSVLKLGWAGGVLRAKIHARYEPPVWLQEPFELSTSESWVERFSRVLPRIRERAKPHDKREGAAEFHVARTNRSPPFVVMDRQVQLPGQRASRVDLVGLECSGDRRPSIVLVELKEGTRLPLSAVIRQVERYEQLYVQGGRLRDDVASSLGRVLAQKTRLGLLDPIPGIASLAARPVELLVILCSRDVAMPARAAWRKAGHPRLYELQRGNEWGKSGPRTMRIFGGVHRAAGPLLPHASTSRRS